MERIFLSPFRSTCDAGPNACLGATAALFSLAALGAGAVSSHLPRRSSSWPCSTGSAQRERQDVARAKPNGTVEQHRSCDALPASSRLRGCYSISENRSRGPGGSGTWLLLCEAPVGLGPQKSRVRSRRTEQGLRCSISPFSPTAPLLRGDEGPWEAQRALPILFRA